MSTNHDTHKQPESYDSHRTTANRMFDCIDTCIRDLNVCTHTSLSHHNRSLAALTLYPNSLCFRNYEQHWDNIAGELSDTLARLRIIKEHLKHIIHPEPPTPL